MIEAKSLTEAAKMIKNRFTSIGHSAKIDADPNYDGGEAGVTYVLPANSSVYYKVEKV